MRTILNEWEEFRAKAVPEHARPRQVGDMRASFFAGAAVAMKLLSEISDTDALADAEIAALTQECSDFFLEMEQGTTRAH